MAHLNNWRNSYKADHRLKPGHITLYYALFHEWNERFFQNPINVYRDEIMEHTRIGSRNTYAQYLRELGEWGYIQYTPDNKSSRGSIIHMIPFDTVTQDQTVEQKDGTSTSVVSPVVSSVVSKVYQASPMAGTDFDTRGGTEEPATLIYNKNNGKIIKGVNGKPPSTPPNNDFFYLNNDKPNAGYTRPLNGMEASYAGAPAGRRPQSVDEAMAFFHEIGEPPDNARKFYNYHEARNWTWTKNRLPMQDWKSAARYWVVSDPARKTGLGLGSSNSGYRDYSIPL